MERSSNADEALDVITTLLEKYGQGGPCDKENSGLVYHNSFIISDPTTAWVLETSGKHWVALQVTSKFCYVLNIVKKLNVISVLFNFICRWFQKHF